MRLPAKVTFALNIDCNKYPIFWKHTSCHTKQEAPLEPRMISEGDNIEVCR